MNDALADLIDRAADSALDNTDAAAAFALLGVSVEDGVGRMKSADVLLADMADALAAFESPADRMTLAMRALGDEAALKLMPILNKGSAALEQYAKVARESGSVMSESLVKMLARQAEEATKAELEWQGLKNTLSQDFTPAATEAAESVRMSIRAVREWWQNLPNVGLRLRGIIDEQGNLTEKGIELGFSQKAASEAIESVGGAAANAGINVRQLAADLQWAEQQMGAFFKDQEKRQAESQKRRAASAQRAAERQAEIDRTVAEQQTAEFERAIDAFAEAEKQKTAALAANARERSAIRDQQAKETAAANEARAIKDAAFMQAQRDQQIAQERQAAQERQQIASQTAQFMGAQIGQALGSMIDGSKTADEAMRGMFANLANYAINAAIEFAFAEAAKAAASQAAADVKIAADASGAASGAINAHSNIPFVGVALGIAAAGAAIAAIMSMKQFQRGGMVEGGIPGADSVAAWLTPGEVVLPTRLVREMSSLMGMTGAAGPTPNAAAAPTSAAAPRIASAQQPGGSSAPVNLTVNFQSLSVPNRAEGERFVRNELMPMIRRAEAAGA
jgi:hypothetical protein